MNAGQAAQIPVKNEFARTHSLCHVKAESSVIYTERALLAIIPEMCYNNCNIAR